MLLNKEKIRAPSFINEDGYSEDGHLKVYLGYTGKYSLYSRQGVVVIDLPYYI